MISDCDTIYLDYAATTPVDPMVAASMQPWLTGEAGFGNPSSIHRFGRKAREALDSARDSVARLLGSQYSEVTFTSGGTEADNLAIIGAMSAAATGRDQLVTTAVEHHAVLHAAHFLETRGYQVTIVPVDKDGCVSMVELDRAISSRTALVSVMHANNEIGSIQPIAQVARIAHDRGALFHTDAVQSASLLPLNVDSIDCDLLSISAHKLYGPKGVGALYVRTATPLAPMQLGGAQERERRAGTENVPAIVGFGVAADLAIDRIPQDGARLTALRDGFIRILTSLTPGLTVNGHMSARLPNNVNISVDGADGSTLLMNLDRLGVCAASGAACSSGSIEPSHVLKAIGLSPERASGGVRFSLGRGTTEEELTKVAHIVSGITNRLLSLSG